MERFIIQPSEKKQDHWVCTDQENMLMCIFENKRFNDTQEFIFLEDPKTIDPQKLAKMATDMADWLRANHYKKAMP
jgi:hypothetical protein